MCVCVCVCGQTSDVRAESSGCVLYRSTDEALSSGVCCSSRLSPTLIRGCLDPRQITSLCTFYWIITVITGIIMIHLRKQTRSPVLHMPRGSSGEATGSLVHPTCHAAEDTFCWVPVPPCWTDVPCMWTTECQLVVKSSINPHE